MAHSTSNRRSERTHDLSGLGFAIPDLSSKFRKTQNLDNYRPVPDEGDEDDASVPLQSHDQSRASYPPGPSDEVDEVETPDLETPLWRPKRRARFKPRGVEVNCAVFAKSLGVLVVLYVGWTALKWTLKYVEPVPPAPQGIPVFGTQLGCDGAVHYYLDPSVQYTTRNSTFVNIPINNDNPSFLLQVTGSIATGTITIDRQPDASANDVSVELSIHSPEPKFDFGARPTDGEPGFLLVLYEDSNDPGNCVQYEIGLRLPWSLGRLKVDAQSLAQIKFNDSLLHDQGSVEASQLESLDISLKDTRSSNLLVLNKGLPAEDANISVSAGYLTGSLPLLHSLNISTEPQATALLAVEMYDSREGTALLETHSGTLPFTLNYTNPLHHRCVYAMHESQGALDLNYTSEGDAKPFRGAVAYTSQVGYALDGEVVDGEVNGGGCDTLLVNSTGWLNLSL